MGLSEISRWMNIHFRSFFGNSVGRLLLWDSVTLHFENDNIVFVRCFLLTSAEGLLIADNFLINVILASIILILHQQVFELAIERLLTFADPTAIDGGGCYRAVVLHFEDIVSDTFNSVG
jgi:hypothetical protein